MGKRPASVVLWYRYLLRVVSRLAIDLATDDHLLQHATLKDAIHLLVHTRLHKSEIYSGTEASQSKWFRKLKKKRSFSKSNHKKKTRS